MSILGGRGGSALGPSNICLFLRCQAVGLRYIVPAKGTSAVDEDGNLLAVDALLIKDVVMIDDGGVGVLDKAELNHVRVIHIWLRGRGVWRTTVPSPGRTK